MLPSTGYFKGINCPFYDSGLCERPYCHFRHVKKESSLNAPSEGIENGAILQKLVSAAVQKVLQQTEASSTTTTTPNVIVEDGETNKVNNSQHKATYNPTPIAELNKINCPETVKEDDVIEQRKRHIPVPYTPRKPASMPIKRPIENNGSSKPFVFIPPLKYTPGCTESVQLDPYTPKGSVDSEEKYLPGTETELQEYTPKETQSTSKHNYVPSDRNVSKKKVLEYKPTKVNKKAEKPSVTYQPTPKSLVPCFSSDEDEPDSKKIKLSNDLNGLDDLGPEFDILDQILDEEKLDYTTDTSNKEKEELKPNSLTDNIQTNEKSNETSKKDKKSLLKLSDKKSKPKSDTKESQEKTKVEKDKKDKSSTHNKSDESKLKVTDKKSHKSSSRDKNREEKKDKSSDKDRRSSSKNNDKTLKHSKHSSSKSSDRNSKHSSSSSSKYNTKRKKESGHHNKSSKDSSKDKHKKSKEKKSRNNNSTENDILMNIEDTSFDNNDDEIIEMSESDEETIALECKRIFEEYVPSEKNTINTDEVKNQLVESNNESEYVPSKKRISRTTDKQIKVLPKAPLKPDYKISAAQTMAERLAKIKEFHLSKNSQTPSSNEKVSAKQEPAKTSINMPQSSSNAKIRIAHVPYASTMMNAKKTITPIFKTKSDEPSTSSTVVQTVKKGIQRVAHIPNEKFIDRPGVLEPLASKIAANIRSTYLNMMIDECLKIYLSANDAYARAQHEELVTSKKCSTIQIYKNSAVLTVSRLRKELQECNGIKKSGSECSALNRIPKTVSGNNVGSWSIESKKTVNNSLEFTGAKFYKNIYKWVLTEEQLQENGFPRPHSSGEKGRAIIYGENKKIPPKGLIRTCCRCKKDYIVDKKGFPAIQEECIYHPNNKYRVRGEVKYQCCSQDSSSDGCCVAPCHVYEYVDFENLKGFIKTMPPDFDMDDYGVYSLDCEMCYTTQGLDLTRVTVIDSSCKVVYETLIKPLHPIIDYNTRYSGITEEQMASVKTTLLEVQATLLSMFSSKTILVGHSLESDFKALKLIHDTVIDTSVLFPHKMGPPFKRALRNLTSEYLKKIIQNSVDGHDSAEDATVCMELLNYKLKEDLKTR